LVAIVGPLSSFTLGGLALVAASLSPPGSAAQAVLGYLGIINVLLGGFNLIPGFPLDGGRVLRSIVWRATGSLRRATEIAGSVGIFVAYGFFIWGFLRVLNGDLLGGLWIGAIGWFLHSAAGASIEQVRVEASLRGATVRQIVRPDERSVPPDLPVARLIEEYLLPLNRRAMPVASAGRVVGMITLGDIKDVPEERRPTTRVADVMGGRDGIEAVQPDDTLADALATLGRGDHEQVPVIDDGRLVGVLTRADVVRQFQLREALGVEGERSRPAKPRLFGGTPGH
ncbi:MAG TPA: CBS domain-containing protein, partial [Vitreimonas sp.]|nr:CBS domain-containing protein [Vitreimonas sp.]